MHGSLPHLSLSCPCVPASHPSSAGMDNTDQDEAGAEDERMFPNRLDIFQLQIKCPFQ